MEELLREILAELKQINSGVIISGNDLCALLEREKEASAQRSRSVFNTVLAKGDTEAKEIHEMGKAIDKNGDEIDAAIAAIKERKEKPDVKEYTLQEIVDKIHSLLDVRMSSGVFMKIGDAIVRRLEVKAIEDIRRSDTNSVRATIYLDNGSNLTAKINLDWLMS